MLRVAPLFLHSAIRGRRTLVFTVRRQATGDQNVKARREEEDSTLDGSDRISSLAAAVHILHVTCIHR